jgi:CRP/FNR family transcriptional regulator, cyclic AMP receptor protein
MFKSIFILSELDNDDLDWIAQKGKKRMIKTGKTLIYEGRNINALYMILEGMFKVTTQASGEQIIAKLSSGELLGEISFIDPRPPIATVTALEDSIVLEISRLELNFKLFRNIGFASRFYRGLCMCLADRMHKTVQQLGYNKDSSSSEDHKNELEELNPYVLNNLEVAQAKFNWLIANTKF